MKDMLKKGFLIFCCIALIPILRAQPDPWSQELPLADLSSFLPAGSNWQIAGGVRADLDKDRTFITDPGTGVLVNLPSDKGATNLTSTLEHGDIELSLEFMMARHSNSGIYLQGRYEIQLLDSWGKSQVTYGDCGGIYERWDDSQPQGEEGFEGYAPRQNVCRAPGLWQKLSISFQAPRFSPEGKKVQDAQIERIELNGIVIHENVALTGPTRGPAFEGEAPRGPLFIQGDHGPVAFRNIRYRLLDAAPVAMTDISYKTYAGIFNEMPDLASLRAVASGKSEILTQEVVKENEKFIFTAEGKVNIQDPGLHRFTLQTSGNGELWVDGKPVIPYGWWSREGTCQLDAGEHTLSLRYHKRDSWYPNSMGLLIEGPTLKQQALHAMSSTLAANVPNPIPIEVGNDPRITRCFIDYPGGRGYSPRRLVHAISVGHPSGTHYTFDPDRANLALVWKGKYLDATPMWDNRGNGSSRPDGSWMALGDASNWALLVREDSAWPDSLGDAVEYRFNGYRVDADNQPVFMYEIGGVAIEDQIEALEGGKMLRRSLNVAPGMQMEMSFRLGWGDQIIPLGKGRYLIDHQYYIQVQDNKGQQPKIRAIGEKQELLLPVQSKGQPHTFSYDLIW